MNQLRVNKEQVSHIKIYDLSKTNYFYKPETIKKYFFGLFKETEYEGYYLQSIWYKLTTEEAKSCIDLIDIDGILWRVPKIEIFAGKEKIKTKYFKTLEECKEYCDLNLKNVNVVL